MGVEDYESKLIAQKTANKKMEEKIQSLNEQLESLKLRCSNGPSPAKRDSLSSNFSNSSSSSHCSSSSNRRTNRKRPRDEMESDQSEPINSNPTKKRKITVQNASEMDTQSTANSNDNE